jgi:hypothetical protein
MYHITKCTSCEQVVSISNGYDKIKMIGLGWDTHKRMCMTKFGKVGFTRVYPFEREDFTVP